MGANNTHIDHLLVKYLGAEATADEILQVQLWLAAGEENAAYLAQYKLIWEASAKLGRNSGADEDAAWQRLHMRMETSDITVYRKTYRIQWLRAVAIFIVVCGATFWGVKFLRHEDNVVTTIPPKDTAKTIAPPIVKYAIGAVMVDTLPDRSTVTLNKYSLVSYPASFDSTRRYTELKGEAFFNIKHNAVHPFTVKAGDIQVTVLGTSFNIKMAGDTTEVIVASGTVKVQKKQATVLLHTGEKTTVVATDSVLNKQLNHSNRYRRYFEDNAGQNTGTFDLSKHPDIVKQLLKDPNKWASILKSINYTVDDLAFRRQVINNVLNELEKEHIISRDSVSSFRLNENEFIINDQRQPDNIFQQFKNKFIKEVGYAIYLGGATKGSNRGVFLPKDSL